MVYLPRLSASLICLSASLAQAQADILHDFQFSGFASFGAGKVTEEGLAFADYQNDWSFDTDTILGLQAQTRLAERVYVTGQVVARGFSYNGRDDYEPAVSWLFLSYQLAPEIQIRAGRMRTPHYLYSDTLEVGYSYVWVRPPVDVYTPLFEPLSNFDGADIRVSQDIVWGNTLDAEGELHVYAGQLEEQFVDFELNGDKMLGANVSITQGQVKFRYALMALELDISSPSFTPLIEGFNVVAEVIPAFAGQADNWSQTDGWFYYHGLGMQFFYDRLVLTAEWYSVAGPDEGFATDSSGWFVSVQHTWGRFTPYAVIGAYQSETNPAIISSINATFDDLPRGVNEAVDQLRNGALFAAESFTVKEQTLTLGLRIDVMPNVALKGEWQHFRFADDSTGNLFPDDAANQPDNTSLVSFVVDVVF